MSNAISWIRQAVVEVRHQLRPVAWFLIGWGVVYATLLLPMTTWGLGRLVAGSGQLAVTNVDIAAFLLSPGGLVFLLAGGVLNLAFVYAQQAGLFVIASSAQLGGSPKLSSLLWQNMRRIPLLGRLGLWQLAGFALLLLPFAAIIVVAAVSWLGEHDINYYLATRPAEWVWAVRLTVAALAVYAVAAVILFLRWILAIPYVIHLGHEPIQSLRESWRMTRGKLRLVATPLLVWWAGWIGVSLVLGAFYAVAGKAALDWAQSSVWRLVPALVALQCVALMGGVLGSVVGGVIHQFLVARLYWHLHPTVSRSTPVPPTPAPRLRWALAGVVGVALLASAGVTWGYARTVTPEISVEITAHRGSSRRAPENTLSAIRQAIAERADYAEIDVQSTKDGAVVMLHDADLMRLARDPRKVAELTLVELKQLDVGSWFSDQFKDERPATLQEVIQLARGHIKLNIELKYNRPDPELAGRVLAVLRAENFIAQCVVTSLSAEDLTRLKQAAPELHAGLIVTAALGDYTRLPVDFLSLNLAQVKPATVATARRNGKAIHVWTVNEQGDALRMIERGADNLITDDPAKLVELRRQLRELNPVERLAVAWGAKFVL